MKCLHSSNNHMACSHKHTHTHNRNRQTLIMIGSHPWKPEPVQCTEGICSHTHTHACNWCCDQHPHQSSIYTQCTHTYCTHKSHTPSIIRMTYRTKCAAGEFNTIEGTVLHFQSWVRGCNNLVYSKNIFKRRYRIVKLKSSSLIRTTGFRHEESEWDTMCCCAAVARCYLWQRTLFGQSALVHFLQQLFESIPDSRVVPLFTGQVLQLRKTTMSQNHTHNSVTSLDNKLRHKRTNHKNETKNCFIGLCDVWITTTPYSLKKRNSLTFWWEDRYHSVLQYSQQPVSLA